MKNLYSQELADRLNVSRDTLHKREFQQRLKLPILHMGKRIYIPEPVFEEWALNPAGYKNEKA